MIQNFSSGRSSTSRGQYIPEMSSIKDIWVFAWGYIRDAYKITLDLWSNKSLLLFFLAQIKTLYAMTAALEDRKKNSLIGTEVY